MKTWGHIMRILALLGIFMPGAGAQAKLFVFEDAPYGSVATADNYDDIMFPGYFDSTNVKSDEWGTPKIDRMEVTVDDDSGLLERVDIVLHGSRTRQYFDHLFINADFGDTDLDWHGWDYLVHSGGSSNAWKVNGSVPGNGLYTVADHYTYTTVKRGFGGRSGHPNGIDAADLALLDAGFVGRQIDYVISYDFNALADGIYVGESFSMAYSPWCANDIIGAENIKPISGFTSSVPVPGTAFLFGTGIAGMVGVSRRRRKRCDH